MSVALLAKELRSYKAKEARKSNQAFGTIVITRTEAALADVPKLNEVEISSLKNSIDPLVLRRHGYSISTRGAIIDANQNVLFKPGFRDAIEKILALHNL
jgi:hypothetical protein